MNMSCTVSAVNPHGFRVMLPPEGDFHPKYHTLVFHSRVPRAPRLRGLVSSFSVHTDESSGLHTVGSKIFESGGHFFFFLKDGIL